MTTTTISPTDVSAALIAFLKSDPAIVAVFGQEIREMDWMSPEFAYPALRMDVANLPEQSLNGNCKGKWFEMMATIYIFVEGTSSKLCQDYMGLVGKRFQNAQIQAVAIKTMPLNVNYMLPVSDGISLWRGEVNVTGRLYEA